MALAGAAIGCIVATDVVAAECMENDWKLWGDKTDIQLGIEGKLMEYRACRQEAGLIEGDLNDRSACNWFAARALGAVYGIDDFLKNNKLSWMSANEMLDYVKQSDRWTRLGDATDNVALQNAAAGAASGHAILAIRRGAPHGHVAVILPGELKKSTTWNMDVPNSASFQLDSVDNSYVGCRLSAAFQSPKGVELYFRDKAVNLPAALIPFSSGNALVQRKLFHFGMPTPIPQSRATCVKWASGTWPWGGGWKECVGHKIEWRSFQKEVWIVVNGPKTVAEAAEGVVKATIAICTKTAYDAAVAAAALAPEIGSKIVAAAGAVPTTFYGCIQTKKAILGAAVGLFKVSIDQRDYWGDWG